MKTLLEHIKPYRVAVFVAVFLMLVELIVELMQPFIISRMIDDGIMQEDMGTVLRWGGVLVSLSLLAFTAGIINSFYAAHVSQHVGYNIRQRLYKRVQTFAFSNFHQFPVSSLLTRMTNDVTQVQNTLFMSLRIMFRAPLLLIGAVIMALIVNVQLAVILVITVPLLIAFLIKVMTRAGRQFSQVQARVDRVNSVVQENLTAVRLIRVYLRQKYEQSRFHQASDQLKQRTVSALRTVEFTMPVILLLMNGSIMAILWFGSVQITTNTATVGEVVAIINYATRMITALSVFSMIIMIFSRAKASVARIEDVITTEDDLKDGTKALSPIYTGKLHFDNVSFQYPESEEAVLQNISFTIKPGQRVAVLGATGSGKTSLFQLIPRLYDTSRGQIFLDHHDISSLQLKELRQQIGYVSQEAILFSGTIRENISWGNPNATEEEIIQAANDAQIYETIKNLPDQLETRTGQKGITLSGGQKQRISIARALLRKPAVLLLDDCTSALDMKTESNLLAALDQYKMTTLMITQKISTAMKADEVVILEYGELSLKGSHEELMGKSSLYRRLYDSQFSLGGSNYA
ncbi:ABC transporter ATP-binding protein [Salsuginibacillus kocurii]|uniref:ABC transporter ATP-binding protein n=1 Tax=Salsuginibacillus kocurii TaxID=427078 RepID=UPI00037E9A54|nr:ABC transporter ATP-binding protein [Salsuginibacillus kocurii]